MIYILMGVSGSGKSTIGGLLSETLNIPYYDGDDFHPEHNVEKMRNGQPLNDDDRKPWLQSISDAMNSWHKNGDTILGCSALKHSYREILNASDATVQWIFLHGDEELLQTRLHERKGHFFKPELLISQMRALEIPNNAWNFNIAELPKNIVEEIIHRMKHKSNIGVVGMGVMGQNLALNFADNGFHVAAFNRHVDGEEEDVAKNFVNANPEFKTIQPFDQLEPFIASLAAPRTVLFMVKAGAPVDSVINQLTPFLEKGDCLIDGGNSHYSDTNRRMTDLGNIGIQYIGTGISGGEKGARFGPSIMPGGPKETYARIRPLIESIAAKDVNGLPCCAYIGTGGAGHFVKMIHNGIEYAEMQLIADCFHLLHNVGGVSYDRVADIFSDWLKGELDSYLLQITIDILKTTDENGHVLDIISDITSHKGTGSWSVQAGLDLSIPSDSIQSALSARQYSSFQNVRTKINNAYHTSTPQIEVDDAFINSLKSAYQAARVINHIIGFEIIKEASHTYNWQLNLSEISRIWTNGCIIRSKLMHDFTQIFKDAKEDHLLLEPAMISELKNNTADLSAIVSDALRLSVALPSMTACLNYFLALSTKDSAANIISAQRDYFGAHGFFKIGGEEGKLYHAKW